MYSLMGGFYTSLPHLADSMTYVNTDWLKAIGRPMPDTIVEFRDMLRAFKSQNPGLPGSPSDRIPLNFWNAGIQYLAGSWGIQGNYNLNNGKITGTVNTQNYREYLEFLNGLVSEGLVNVEGFSQNREQYASQISAMRVGVFLGWAPTVFIPVAANHPMWDIIPPLAVPGKENLRIFHGASTARSQSSRAGFLITRQSKHQEAAMRWWGITCPPIRIRQCLMCTACRVSAITSAGMNSSRFSRLMSRQGSLALSPPTTTSLQSACSTLTL
jgi:putative aldouronate transport system substrate-binding protein